MYRYGVTLLARTFQWRGSGSRPWRYFPTDVFSCMEITSSNIRCINHHSWGKFPKIISRTQERFQQLRTPEALFYPETSNKLVDLALDIPQIYSWSASLCWFISKWQMMMAKRNSGNSTSSQLLDHLTEGPRFKYDMKPWLSHDQS